VNEQLSRALNSRIVIEQAKGVLAERSSLDMEQAFARLRGYARTNNLRLADVARDLRRTRLRHAPSGHDNPGSENRVE
jgi:AmiR/NasT family two-component response regulator